MEEHEIVKIVKEELQTACEFDVKEDGLLGNEIWERNKVSFQAWQDVVATNIAKRIAELKEDAPLMGMGY